MTRAVWRNSHEAPSKMNESKEFAQWTYPKEVTPITPVFIVSPENGFLPRTDPILLPAEFKELSDLLDAMSVKLPDGTPGLLARGEFGAAAEKLPVYDVSGIEDQSLLMALFRDYTFLTSSYLLEPCDILNRSKGHYGRGRSVLCKSLAVPLMIIAEKIQAKPFMEYAQSYALYNYQRIDKSKPLDYDNLELIRKFSGLKSEHGFICIHVAMVRHTGKFVKAVMEVLGNANKKNREEYNKSMSSLVAVMKDINAVMENMWKKSAPADYMKFRTFIMGTKGQEEMFPDGVVYEGVDKEPKVFRGESGANDSIIPTCDNLLQLVLYN
jgi:indoleamine 2,3-dioxygenase